MLMREEFSAAGMPDGYRLSHVRRKGDGTWERCLTGNSYEMEVSDPPGFMFDEAKARMKRLAEEGPFWEPFGDATLETAYQRFIHAQDIHVAAFDRMWREDEEKHLVSLRARLAASQSKVARPLELAPQQERGKVDWASTKEKLAALISQGQIDTARALAKSSNLMGTFDDLMCMRKS